MYNQCLAKHESDATKSKIRATKPETAKTGGKKYMQIRINKLLVIKKKNTKVYSYTLVAMTSPPFCHRLSHPESCSYVIVVLVLWGVFRQAVPVGSLVFNCIRSFDLRAIICSNYLCVFYMNLFEGCDNFLIPFEKTRWSAYNYKSSLFDFFIFF